MSPETRFTARVSLIVALGGFLMGFDASVISGVVGFIQPEFGLSQVELGWSVASLTLTATLAMMLAGPLSDRLGRRRVLMLAALLFLISAVGSALAGSFTALVAARMLGGLGVGAALIIAPMYIAEISPASIRGRLVSLNQLNIVIGISAAFFVNYLILKLSSMDSQWIGSLGLDRWTWRWMLGIEALPAAIYLACLQLVPESPRWLLLQGRQQAAHDILIRTAGPTDADQLLDSIRQESDNAANHVRSSVWSLFKPRMRQVIVIGVIVAVAQQITGINAVFFYAPMIFEQSGVGTDAAFGQAVAVGLVNLCFTVVAISLIDKIGRRPLLNVGLAGIALCMFLLAWAFNNAAYEIDMAALEQLNDQPQLATLSNLAGQTFDNDLDFRKAMLDTLGEQTWQQHESALISATVNIDSRLVLAGILGFVACFAMSLGPVMWVLFSELFPNSIRGLAISFVGLINSAVSFTVQLLFPWEMTNLGNAVTFLLYGFFALIALGLLSRLLPETRGQTLEQIERELVYKPLS